MFRRKWVLVLIVLVLVGGGASAYFSRKGDQGVTVTAETIQKRDLEAIVSASGKIDPKKTVNISAQSMGRVTRLAVNEGDRVKAGQFLLQIDAVNAEAAVRRDEAAVAGARTALEQSKVTLQSVRASLESSRQALKRQRELSAAGLTTKESLEKAETDVEVRESDLKAREQEIKNRETQLNQQEAGLASSKHTLSQVRFEAPFDGIVTRRNIEEGENVMVGTMNNAGTVLLTVADMSVIEAEVEVDETDIPFVQLGQAAKITIDAIPDKSFTGKVTEIGNSPIQTTGTGTTRTATNFKVTVTIDGQIPDVRPGFTCTAEITTATRAKALVGADPVADDSGAALRREGQRRARAAAGEAALPVRAGRHQDGRRGQHRAAARPEARRDGGRVPHPRRQGGLRAGQAGHLRRAVPRGHVGPEGRRPRDHRSVRLGARPLRRRRGQGSPAGRRDDGGRRLGAGVRVRVGG